GHEQAQVERRRPDAAEVILRRLQVARRAAAAPGEPRQREREEGQAPHGVVVVVEGAVVVVPGPVVVPAGVLVDWPPVDVAVLVVGAVVTGCWLVSDSVVSP